MTTTAWMRLPAELLDTAALVPIHPVEVLWARTSTVSGDPCIHVVDIAGVRYIEDGAHRHAKALPRGDRMIAARVLRVAIRGTTPQT